jgi:hypothetical protein
VGIKGSAKRGVCVGHFNFSEHSGGVQGKSKCFKISTGNFQLRQRHATDMVLVKFNFVLFVFITRVTLKHLYRELDYTCYPSSHLWVAQNVIQYSVIIMGTQIVTQEVRGLCLCETRNRSGGILV